MAVVLTDGGAASAKALDLGSVPGLFMEHDKDQLIVVHGWRNPTSAQLKEQPQKDLSSLSPIATVVEHINKSRVAANTLNYKLEMVKLPPSPTEESESGNGGSGDLPGQSQNPSPAKAPATKPPAKGTPAPPPAPAAAPASTSDDAAKEEENNENTPVVTAATTVADYALDRANHFGSNTFILGVGTGQQGKSLIVGSVAREMLSRHRSSHNLFFLKQSGPIVRPAAAMRMNVLVIPGSDLSHLRYALSIAKPEKKNDRVGVTVVLNNGKPKPQEGVLSVAHAEDDDNAPAPGDVAKECARILAEHGLQEGVADDQNNSSSAQGGAAASGGGGGANTTTTSAAADTFPLVQYMALEPTNHFPTPKVDEVGNQVVKFFSAMKLDFVVLPPAKEGLSEAFVIQMLASQKPHVISVRSE